MLMVETYASRAGGARSKGCRSLASRGELRLSCSPPTRSKRGCRSAPTEVVTEAGPCEGENSGAFWIDARNRSGVSQSVRQAPSMTATLLVVDAGSSSVKLAAYDVRALDVVSSTPSHPIAPNSATQIPRRIARAHAELPDEQRSIAFNAMLSSFLEQNALSDVRAVAHRIVHGLSLIHI